MSLKLLLATTSTLLTCAVFYVGSLGVRSHELYAWVKQIGEKHPLSVYVADAQLGYRSIPSAESVQPVPGNPVYVKFDERGLRIPEFQPSAIGDEPHPRILFLGDSWTHGAACEAEDSFPFVAGRELGGTSWNAGMGAYGLGQMVLRARLLIPELRPDYVVAQYSTWLVTRAQRYYADSAFGTVPAPYFAIEGDELVIEPPVFATNNYAVPIWEFPGPAGLADFVQFFFRVGRRVFGYSDWQRTLLLAREHLGRVPPPTRDRERVVAGAYGEISRLARASGASTIVVTMGRGCSREALSGRDDLSGIVGVRIVDAHAKMCRLLRAEANESGRPETGNAWDRAYSHWDGARVINRHPNPTGHEIIGKAVAREIRRLARPEAPRAFDR